MSELTYIRPGSKFLGAEDKRHEVTGALIVELSFWHPTHPQTIQIDYYVWHASPVRVEPRGWLAEPEATVIDGSPGDLFDEPPAPVSVPSRRVQFVPDPAHCSVCGRPGDHLVRGGDGRWYCPESCRPDADPTDPAGAA